MLLASLHTLIDWIVRQNFVFAIMSGDLFSIVKMNGVNIRMQSSKEQELLYCIIQAYLINIKDPGLIDGEVRGRRTIDGCYFFIVYCWFDVNKNNIIELKCCC